MFLKYWIKNRHKYNDGFMWIFIATAILSTVWRCWEVSGFQKTSQQCLKLCSDSPKSAIKSQRSLRCFGLFVFLFSPTPQAKLMFKTDNFQNIRLRSSPLSFMDVSPFSRMFQLKKNFLDCFPKLKDGTIYGSSDFRFTWKAVLELLLVHSSKDLCESYKSYLLWFNCRLWQIWAQFP